MQNMSEDIKSGRKFRLTPIQKIGLSFLGLILVGTLILCMPFSARDGAFTPLADSLFTATSAVCVTGLATLEISEHFNLFGQIIILLLVQAGGLGFMTIVSLFSVFAGKRITLSDRLVMQEQYSQDGLAGLIKTTKRIIAVTFITEGIGAVLLTAGFCLEKIDFWTSLYYGIFHSVSAFCNAGLSVVSTSAVPSLSAFTDNILVNVTVMLLIIIGGLGFLAVLDVGRNKRWRKISFQTKSVIIASAALIFSGTLITALGEWNNVTMEGMTTGEKIMASFFQSVTSRTAGFQTIDQSQMSAASKINTMVLMFIGASPAGTGGGIKTMTLVILLYALRSGCRGDDEIIVREKRIGNKLIVKILAMVFLALAAVLLFTVVICLIENGKEGFTAESVLFECISAYATVGLSFGITPALSVVSKLLIIIMMYMGRLSVLFIGLFVTRKRPSIKYIEEKISL